MCDLMTTWTGDRGWLLAQGGAATAAAEIAPWWRFLIEQAFGLTILLIFVSAVVSVLLTQWRKDPCLKLLHGSHATALGGDGAAVWGDLVVLSRGVELTFDAVHRGRRGVAKSSVLIYPPVLETVRALCRVDQGLTPGEQAARRRQVQRSFRPGLLRRTGRSLQNLLNTFRDAFAKAFSAFVGQLTKAKPGGAIAGRQADVTQLGTTLLSAAGNAYEPLLERHVGQPVVVSLTNPADETAPPLELPGYLVDYTEKYVAVFNVEHTVLDAWTLTLTPDGAEATPANVRATLSGSTLQVDNPGPEAIRVQRVARVGPEGGAAVEPNAVLLPGTHLRLTLPGGGPVQVAGVRTRRMDLVCPRRLATVRFGGEYEPDDDRHHADKAGGVAPAGGDE